jgi:hypothetical protein
MSCFRRVLNGWPNTKYDAVDDDISGCQMTIKPVTRFALKSTAWHCIYKVLYLSLLNTTRT